MKTCIVFCAIAALCVVQAVEGSNTNRALKSRVHGLKTTAQTTANNLIQFKEHTRSNFDAKLAEAKTDYVKEANDIVDLDIEAIRRAADAAKAEGRNSDACFQNAQRFYTELLINVNEDLHKCLPDSISIIESALEHVQATIGVAQNDASEIGMIIPGCQSSNQITERSCLSDNLVSANKNVNNLRSTAVRVKQAAETASAEALEKAHLCLSAKLDPVSNTSVYHRFQALNCIKVAA